MTIGVTLRTSRSFTRARVTEATGYKISWSRYLVKFQVLKMGLPKTSLEIVPSQHFTITEGEWNKH